MRRYLFGLLMAPFILNAASAQTAEIVKEIDDKLKALRTVDESLRQALANHPDVLVATAKLRVAEAELAQVKLVLAQKIAGLKAEIEIRKSQLAVQEEFLKQMNASGAAVAMSERVPVQMKYTELKSGLSRLVAEYDGLTKPAVLSQRYSVPVHGPAAEITFPPPNGGGIGTLENGIGNGDAWWLAKIAPTPGSPAEKLRAVLDRSLKLDIKSQPANEVIRVLLKGLKSDLTVRMPYLEPGMLKDTNVTLEGEMTLGPWLELILDEINTKLPTDTQLDVFVREYGLLIAPRSSTPKDALTLRQFVAGVRAEKAAAEPKKP